MGVNSWLNSFLDRWHGDALVNDRLQLSGLIAPLRKTSQHIGSDFHVPALESEVIRNTRLG